MSKKISYATRDFAGLRNELVGLTKDYYPDLVKNFNDASIYSVLLDINAAVADNLHFHIDRVWQETMLDFAQQRQSLFHIAKTYGMHKFQVEVKLLKQSKTLIFQIHSIVKENQIVLKYQILMVIID